MRIAKACSFAVRPLFFPITVTLLMAGGCERSSNGGTTGRIVAGGSGSGSTTGGSFGNGGASSAPRSGDSAGREATVEGGAGEKGGAGGKATMGGMSTGSGTTAGTGHSGGSAGGDTSSQTSTGGSTGGSTTSGGSAGGTMDSRGGQGGNGGAKTGGAGASTGGSSASTGMSGGAVQPSTFKVFDQIPQFGIYAESNPKNYSPPEGVLMWSFGTLMVRKLSDAEKARILSKLSLRLTYHAQCDNYDRLGSLFFILKPSGQAPNEKDPRIELVRFITPFSNYTRGTLATYVYADADISAYAGTLADASQDVWLGIASGANPYDGDPCTNAQVTPEFRQVGYKISAELLSSGAPVNGTPITLSAKSYQSETSLPVRGSFENPGETLSGRITVIVSGHGSSAGGCEYMHTDDVVRVNDQQVGAFSTQIDCATYARYSPDGNQGIFRNNGTSNPRNWCPGSLVAPRTYPVTLKPGANPVTLSISPAQVPSGSYYSTTIVFTSP